MSEKVKKKTRRGRRGHKTELGTGGVVTSGGLIRDSFLTQLNGANGRKVYREMAENDATIGAVLTAIQNLLLGVEWEVVSSELDTDEKEKEFVESVLKDMDYDLDDVNRNVLTMLPFGWSWHEVVYKMRRDNINDDGRFGIKRIAHRAQETIERWDFADNGDVNGLYQRHPDTGKVIYLPKHKSLHFRTTIVKNNPEGRSVLRNAYTSYYYLKNLQEIESIAIEREMTGVPVVSVPNEILSDPANAAIKNIYTSMARDLNANQQGGLVIPSDTYIDDAGKVSNVKKVDVKLIASAGTRSIDTNVSIQRYQGDMSRSVLADFLNLGGNGDRGSFALSSSKVDLFLRSIEGYLSIMASVYNKQLLPALWALNNLDVNTMPKLVPGKVAPANLVELGNYLEKLKNVGIPIDNEIANLSRKALEINTEAGEDVTLSQEKEEEIVDSNDEETKENEEDDNSQG
tara:strand:+ start:443 stop:1816 length:1374 start_codon:yes stop_codon:yes gene_type:complete